MERWDKLPRFVTLDIVFEAGSLNYDEGAGNYQQLKKVTLYDGALYTMVSRYALRYSIMETMKDMYGKNVELPGKLLTKETGGREKKNVLQPKRELLYTGEILKYPELDLFGFLLTETKKTSVARESPVKITHAISLTPYEGDTHMSGNHSLARRAYEAGVTDKFEPNLFVVEEHRTLYKYSVVIDREQIGKFVFYVPEDEAKDIQEGEHSDAKVKKEKVEIAEEKNENKKKSSKIGPLYRITVELSEELKRKHLEMLVEAILKLRRRIKGRNEDLSPRVLAVGLWDKTYQSLFNYITIEGTYEEVYETEEREVGDKKEVIRRVIKRRSPRVSIDGKSSGFKVEEKEWNEVEIKKLILGEEKYEEGTFYVYSRGIPVITGVEHREDAAH